MANESRALPQHVAIIMDGNGRWARQKGRPRIFGHKQGTNSTREAIRHASDLGIKFLSLYVFSSENWQRPPKEVTFLMGLLGDMIESEIKNMMEKNVRLRVLGDLTQLPDRTRRKLQEAIDRLDANTGLTLQLCISYGGRLEILQGVQAIARKIQAGEIKPEEISEDMISAHMYEPQTPDPELMIRTGGEYRISNFLLWQFAYSELFVSPLLWPDFGTQEFDNALAFYMTRERRFGRVLDAEENE